ncbi:MAG: replication protein [Clostridia bacterium]|nr:replication protein [Clostridia bacterium]
MSEKVKKSSSRTRNFATIVYPESAPVDWIDILSAQFVPSLISPLHDRDINQKSEHELKKAHYHVILMFDSVKTREQAEALIKTFGGVGCEVVNSIRGYARYLCHKDNPDKAQYDEDLVTALCGADYHNIVGLPTDKYEIIDEMVEWCVDNGVVSYSELFNYARIHKRHWFRSLCDNSTVVMKEFLKSEEWRRSRYADNL